MLDKLAALFPARTMRVIHIYSSMLMLIIMLFFTLTGITLNHPDWFRASAPAAMTETGIPQALLDQAQQQLGDGAEAVQPLDLALPLIRWLRQQHQVQGQELRLEWDAQEQLLVADIQQPGGYSIAEFDLANGLLTLERKPAGLIAQLNDLHKGRHTGAVWRAFIDVSAAVLLLFTLSGFWLLLPQKKRRHRALSVSALGGALFLFLYWHTL